MHRDYSLQKDYNTQVSMLPSYSLLTLTLALFSPLTSYLYAGMLPFENTVVVPNSYVAHIERIALIDEEGVALEMLPSPISCDLINAQYQLPLASFAEELESSSRKPTLVRVQIGRQFDIAAEGIINLPYNQVARVHTQTGLPHVQIGPITYLALASSDENNPTLQSTYLPKSELIDKQLMRAGFLAQGSSLIVTLPIDQDPSTLQLTLDHGLVEFGDSPYGLTFFVVPYLPEIKLEPVS